jgi:glyceraldehyde 3-phosphate dehydrogenase
VLEAQGWPASPTATTGCWRCSRPRPCRRPRHEPDRGRSTVWQNRPGGTEDPAGLRWARRGAVNDIADTPNLAYLLSYDTVCGWYQRAVSVEEGALIVDGQRIAVFIERAEKPIVGPSRGRADAGVHRGLHPRGGLEEARASRCVLGDPVGTTKPVAVPTVVHGVNRPDGEPQIISCAAARPTAHPVIKTARRWIGFGRPGEDHRPCHTGGQQLVDGPPRASGGAGRARPTWY